MARPRKLWSYSKGDYGETVTLVESRLAGPLRWNYRDGATRVREEVKPRVRVRHAVGDDVDRALVKKAEALCDTRHAKLLASRAEVRAKPTTAESLTVADAFALYHDPTRNALPASDSGKAHHIASRAFWLAELKPDTFWNNVPPADVWGPLVRLKGKGQVATATKRFQNLRTLYRWLHGRMRIRGLEDPTLGLNVKELRAGYRERRPRLYPGQVDKVRAVLPALSWRMRLFLTLMISSGTRGIQARNAMRSGLDASLEPMPSEIPPHGWFLFIGVKGQRPHLTYLTKGQRREIDAAIAGPLAAWEAAYQAGEITDYPLLPAGRFDSRRKKEDATVLMMRPVSDNALRHQLAATFAKAGIPKTDRLGFHAIRRGWADMVRASEGMDAVVSAGGWSRRETAEGYLSEYQHEDIEKARRRMEQEEGK